MFRFESPIYLSALGLLLPLWAVAAYTYRQHRHRRERLGSAAVREKLLPPVLANRQRWQLVLFSVAYSLLVVAWANPQWSLTRKTVQTKGTDVFIGLDISNSMLATDVSPNRLERAKQVATRLVEALKGNRIGVIVFSGNAYLQMPLTADYAAAQLFIKSAEPSMAPRQGTAIGECIRLANEYFLTEEAYQRVLVLLTDGETHDADAVAAATVAHEKGLIIQAIGVGSAQGGTLPVDVGGVSDVRRDAEGTPIVSALDAELLASLATATQGASYILDNNAASLVKDVASAIDKVQKRDMEIRSFEDYESFFQYFLAAALVLLWLYYWRLRA